MKILERKIKPFMLDSFFFPIRSAKEYCTLILRATQLLLSEDETYRFLEHEERAQPYIKIIISEFSRLFLYKDSEHYYSCSFPFSITEDNYSGEPIITSKNNVELSFQTISFAMSILNKMKTDSVIDVALTEDNSDPIPFDIYNMVENIFQQEFGYLRYDKDEERENGRIHPLFHLDINYAQYCTYKIGLNRNMTNEQFESLIDNAKERRYIENL